MTEQDWDETESEEEEAARLEKWLTLGRAVWYIELETEERPLFAGVWYIEEEYDEFGGQMILSSMADFPDFQGLRVEVHRLVHDERPDKYQPKKFLEHAFKHSMVVRPVQEEMKKRKEGDKWIISLDQDEKINHLRLSGRLDDF